MQICYYKFIIMQLCVSDEEIGLIMRFLSYIFEQYEYMIIQKFFRPTFIHKNCCWCLFPKVTIISISGIPLITRYSTEKKSNPDRTRSVRLEPNKTPGQLSPCSGDLHHLSSPPVIYTSRENFRRVELSSRAIHPTYI